MSGGFKRYATLTWCPPLLLLAQVADDAAQQAVTVLLRSLPGLKRLLGQVGSETHDGYTHRGKLRSRRDVMQTLVQHTWVLLRDLHLNSMNSGGMGGRTRARRLENLQKELQVRVGRTALSTM